MFEKHPKLKGVFLKIEVCDKTKDAIFKKNLALKAGICVLRLNYKFIQGEAESAREQAGELKQDSMEVNVEKYATAAEAGVAENKND